MSSDLGYVLVTPYSTDEKAVLATASTLEALVGMHECILPLTSTGKLLVKSSDPDFLIFAIKNQGYAADAVRL